MLLQRMIWILVLVGLVFAERSGAVEQGQRPPNIVFLLADDLGWTGLRCFGSDFYETPNLDRLARAGMKFTNAYAACTVCSPTRASIMTGMYPARLHLTDFIAGQNRPFARLQIPDWIKGLDHSHVTLAEALKAAGYRTGQVGKWHLNHAGRAPDDYGPKTHGFDFQIDKPAGTKGYFLPEDTHSRSGSRYLTDYLTDHALEFIDDSKDAPFFLYFAYHVPHTPIQGRDDLVEYFRKRIRPDATHDNPVYAAMVASLDQSVGRVLDHLETLEIADNTLVVFTSDNGGLTQRYGKHDGFTENLPLRRGKGSAYEGGVRVPAIVRWPGVTPAGSVCETPIITTDYYPTLLDIAGAKGDAQHNASVDGVSLTGVLRDPAMDLERDLFWHYPHYHAGGDGPYSAIRSSAIRSGNWRLIEFHESGALELYDLEKDPGEQRNMVSERGDIANDLKDRLDRWREHVGAQMPTPNPDYDPKRAANVSRGRRPAGN